MDFLPGLLFLVAGFAILRWIVSPGMARGLEGFGAGFLPYRSAGWPQGVQEEDPVPWSWPSPGSPDLRGRRTDAGPVPEAELVEIGPADAPLAIALDARPVVARRMPGRRP